MIQILHGDHERNVEAELFAVLNTLKAKGFEVVRLVAKKIEIPDLETAIGTDALFSSQKLVIIEGLFGLPKSKRKDALIAWIKLHDSDSLEIFLIEKKTLTATQLKAFPDAKVKMFKLPALLFNWLETLGSVPARRSLEMLAQLSLQEDVQYVFIMLIRQVRILIAFRSDGVYEGAPFMRSKVAAQASKFSLEQLLKLHSDLLELDEKQKTSQLSMPLSSNLDLLIAGL